MGQVCGRGSPLGRPEAGRAGARPVSSLIASSGADLRDEYRLLRAGRDSSFARRGQVYAPDGGPFELRLVGNGRDELIAVWYHVHDPLPTVPPLLTVFGWYRGANGVDSKSADAPGAVPDRRARARARVMTARPRRCVVQVKCCDSRSASATSVRTGLAAEENGITDMSQT